MQKIKLILSHSSIFIFLALSFGSQAIMAKRMYIPHTEISVQDIEFYYAGLSKKKKLNKEESRVFRMLGIAKQIFNLKPLKVRGSSKSDKQSLVEQVDLNFLNSQLNDEVSRMENWGRPIEPLKASLISKNQKFLKDALESEPYVWSWFLHKINKTEAAKANLQKLYREEHSRVMRLKRVTIGFRRHSPIKRINSIYNALHGLITKAEATKLDEKHRKLKVHVSNLPQSHIKT